MKGLAVCDITAVRRYKNVAGDRLGMETILFSNCVEFIVKT